MGYAKVKKEITIGFRTDREIRKALEKIAVQERQTLSAVIESVLYNYLKEAKVGCGHDQEQRKYARKPVSLPAFVGDAKSDGRALQTGKVLDISLGGIRLSIPRGVKLEIMTDSETNEFHIIFTLPEAIQPINMKCKSQRITDCGENVQVGATFVDSDFQSYQTLQKYLI